MLEIRVRSSLNVTTPEFMTFLFEEKFRFGFQDIKIFVFLNP